MLHCTSRWFVWCSFGYQLNFFWAAFIFHWFGSCIESEPWLLESTNRSEFRMVWHCNTYQSWNLHSFRPAKTNCWLLSLHQASLPFSRRTRKVKPSKVFLQGTSVENHCSHASPVSLCPWYKQLCILSTAKTTWKTVNCKQVMSGMQKHAHHLDFLVSFCSSSLFPFIQSHAR